MYWHGGDSREKIPLSRDVTAIQIPDGTPVTLKAGDSVIILQSLGGTYTVSTYDGWMARIDGKDADALGKEIPAEAAATAAVATGAQSAPGESDPQVVHERVMQELANCYDPEIPVNIVDLGLIYMCELTPLPAGGFKADVRMTLTAPGCGMGDVLKADVETRLKSIPEIKEWDVDLVFDPPWDQSRMTEAARLQLNL